MKNETEVCPICGHVMKQYSLHERREFMFFHIEKNHPEMEAFIQVRPSVDTIEKRTPA